MHMVLQCTLCIGYTMRRGYRIYTAQGTAQGCIYRNPESELHHWLVPEYRGVSDWLVRNCPMIKLLKWRTQETLMTIYRF